MPHRQSQARMQRPPQWWEAGLMSGPSVGGSSRPPPKAPTLKVNVVATGPDGEPGDGRHVGAGAANRRGPEDRTSAAGDRLTVRGRSPEPEAGMPAARPVRSSWVIRSMSFEHELAEEDVVAATTDV